MYLLNLRAVFCDNFFVDFSENMYFWDTEFEKNYSVSASGLFMLNGLCVMHGIITRDTVIRNSHCKHMNVLLALVVAL